MAIPKLHSSSTPQGRLFDISGAADWPEISWHFHHGNWRYGTIDAVVSFKEDHTINDMTGRGHTIRMPEQIDYFHRIGRIDGGIFAYEVFDDWRIPYRCPLTESEFIVFAGLNFPHDAEAPSIQTLKKMVKTAEYYGVDIKDIERVRLVYRLDGNEKL